MEWQCLIQCSFIVEEEREAAQRRERERERGWLVEFRLTDHSVMNWLRVLPDLTDRIISRLFNSSSNHLTCPLFTLIQEYHRRHHCRDLFSLTSTCRLLYSGISVLHCLVYYTTLNMKLHTSGTKSKLCLPSSVDSDLAKWKTDIIILLSKNILFCVWWTDPSITQQTTLPRSFPPPPPPSSVIISAENSHISSSHNS